MSETVYILISVPLVAAFVGWITNWVGVKMIFHPERFVGLGVLGWQGILPRRAPKFARGVAATITEHLISPREMAEKLDPDEMERLFEGTLDHQITDLVREGADLVRPGAWAALPPPVQAMITDQVRRETKLLARDLFDRLQGISGELLDLDRLIVASLSGDNTNTLVRLTKKVGAREFKFIEYYGGVFGFFIGLLQAGMWTWLQTWWTMPIVGAVVGLATNYLAIEMIFRPQEPTRYLGLITYQGLFAKRQAEIARDYGEVAAAEILTPKNLIRLVTEGEAGERIARLVADTVSQRIDEQWSKVEKMVPVAVTPAMLAELKTRIVRRIADTVPEVQPQFEAYLARKLDIASTIESKLATLPKPEFERILRGIFEEDEATVIGVGGVLGAGVGLLQAAMVLAM